jgi:hypothetical protein
MYYDTTEDTTGYKYCGGRNVLAIFGSEDGMERRDNAALLSPTRKERP